MSPRRQAWFDCSCCPTNVARLLASLGGYAYATDGNTLYTNLYANGSVRAELPAGEVRLTQQTEYPWDGRIRLQWAADEPTRATLALRVPAWARRYELQVNDAAWADPPRIERGYLLIERKWQPGDSVTLTLPMPVERVRSHPEVHANAGRVALQRGPLVYAFESCDNGAGLDALALPHDAALTSQRDSDLLGGIVVVQADGSRVQADTRDTGLYRWRALTSRGVRLKAIPYYAWANREPGEMLVWIRER